MGSMTASAPCRRRLVVGTFNTPELFLLSFDTDHRTLTVERTFDAVGNHSWLALNAKHTTLLATCWTEPPSIASYSVTNDGQLALVNTQDIAGRSGYVTVGHGGRTAYTAGGASGEVLALEEQTGRLTATLQRLDYLSGAVQYTDDGAAARSTAAATTNGHRATNGHTNGDGRNTMDFGGLRHGAHSADLSPDGRRLYVADIGRNCVWVHDVDEEGCVGEAERIVSPRPNDGPRHVWPHPAGTHVYVLQEHTSIVDVFRVNDGDNQRLTWVQGVRIIPTAEHEEQYWADEVRTVATGDPRHPELLVASTRGLKADIKGYVALFALTADGLIDLRSAVKAPSHPSSSLPSPPHPHAWLDMWQTPTSGGWANAVEPSRDGQFIALTDSETGLVVMLTVEQRRIIEVARVSLGSTTDGLVRGAATAVWL